MVAQPRKQTFFIFLICLVVVLGVAYYSFGDSFVSLALKKSDLSKNTPISVTQQIITSNDDWKKQFLTASTSSSSFNNDSGKNIPTKEENITATDQLGRDFLTKFAELKQSGLVGDSKTVSSVIAQMTAQSLNKLSSPKTYSISDITVVQNSQPAAKNYADKVSAVFQNYMPKNNEALIAKEAFENNSMEDLKAIDPLITSYKAIVNNLLITQTPQAISEYHLNLLNGFSIASYNAEALRHLDTDPVKGLSAISLELVGMQIISKAITDLQRYFASQGIVF